MWRARLPRDAGPVYKAIADALQRDIASGVLRPGARLPTHRELAAQLEITTLTATRGYAEASRRGLIQSTVGRGTFVSSPVGAERPAERQPIDLARNAITGNESLELDRALLGNLTRLLRTSRYDSPAGTPRHRHYAAEWMGRAHVNTHAGRVALTAGAHHAILSVLQALAAPGATVMTEALTYAGIPNIASILQLKLEPLQLDDDGLRPSAFEKACRSSGSKVLYTIPNFQNPTGTVMPEERRKQICAIARKHGVTIVEDDVYGLFMPSRIPPIVSMLPEQTCYLTSASKSLAPALRLGFISAPEPLIARVESAIAMTTIFTSTVSAEVFASLVESGEADRLVEHKRDVIRGNQRTLRATLARFLRESHSASPHAWLHLPSTVRASDVVARAEGRGVVVAPAEAFAVGEDVPNALRVAIAAAETPAAIDAALRTLATIIEGGAYSPSPLV